MAFSGSQFRKLFTGPEVSSPAAGSSQSRSKAFHKNENKPAEPWHPVQITFDLPSDAAKRLSQLAESDDQALLRELGIISLQVQGEKIISLTLTGGSQVHDGNPTDQQPGSSSSTNRPATKDQASTSSAIQALDLLKGSSVSLKRVASGTARPTFHSTSSSSFNDLGPEKKRRKHGTASSSSNKDIISFGASSFSPVASSGMSDILASDGSHHHHHGHHHQQQRVVGQHGLSSSSKSASLSISSVLGEQNTQSSMFSRLTKTLITDALMPPPPPLTSGGEPDSRSVMLDVPKKLARPAIRLNPNTGLMESGVASGGETSSEGEADQELECRSIKSLDLAITNNKKDNQPAVGNSSRKQQLSKPSAELKLKLKIPPVASRGGVNKRTESQDEPKLPKLILSMRDKTVKMAGLKTASSSSPFIESGHDEDYDDGDEGDDDDEEFDSIKMKNPQQLQQSNNHNVAVARKTATTTSIDRVTAAFSAPPSVNVNSGVTCDSRNAHLEINSFPPTPSLSEANTTSDSSRTTNNHLSDNVWSKSSLGINCNDEINLRLSDPAASSTASTTSRSSADSEIRTGNSSANPKEKEVYQKLVNDTEHLEENNTKSGDNTNKNDIKTDGKINVDFLEHQKYATSSDAMLPETSRVNFADSFNLPSRDTDSHVHQGDDSGIESMDTLSEKSPNQGENPHDDKLMMIELKDLVELPSTPSLTSSHPLLSSLSSTSSSLVRPPPVTNCLPIDILENDDKPSEMPLTPSDTCEEKSNGVGATENVKIEEEEESRLAPSLAEDSVNVLKVESVAEIKPETKDVKEEKPELQESTKKEEEKDASVKEKETTADSTSMTTAFETTSEIVVPKIDNFVVEQSATTIAPPQSPCVLGLLDEVLPSKPEDSNSSPPTTEQMPIEEHREEEQNNKLSNAFLSSKSASVWLASDSNSTSITEVIAPPTTPAASVVVTNAGAMEQPQLQQQQHVIFTKSETGTYTSVLSTATGITIQPSALRRSPAPPTTTSSLNGGYSSAGLQSMRSALNVPAGAKMVPVKLVSVSGEGNVRLVRVSPVKSALHHANDGTSVLSPRTVVIKSSMLKTVAPKVTTSIGQPVATNTTPLPAHLANSQPLSPSLLNNVCKETSSPCPPTSVYSLLNNSSNNDVTKTVVVTSSSQLTKCAPASVLSSLDLLPPSQAKDNKLESFSISAEMKEKLLSTSTATLLATPMLGPSLSITPVWSQIGAGGGISSSPGPTSLGSNISLEKKKQLAVNNDATTAFALRSLEPLPLSSNSTSAKIELEVDTKNKGRNNRPQKKSPLTLNSDFGGSLLRPLLQKEDPVNEVKAKPRPKLETDSPPKIAESLIQPMSELNKIQEKRNFTTTSEKSNEAEVNSDKVGLKNVRCKKEDELTTTTIINDVEVAVNEDAKTANKKSGRIESIKSNVETKGKLGTPKINNKGGATSTALAGTTGASDDSKERRSVRQPALNADGTPKTPAAKMTKKVPNSVIIGLDKDSTNISDWAAAKAKRVTSSATTATMTSSTGQTSTLGMNSVPAGATSSITNSCNVVVETNKNFTEKRIKTRSAKTSDDQLDLKRRRLKLENL